MISTVIVAGGKGKRMGQTTSKQYINIMNREILAWTIKVFEEIDEIDQIVLVIPKDDIKFCTENIVVKYSFKKISCIVGGGSERQQSVYNGLLACDENTDIVLIHDGVRPLINKEIVIETIKCALQYGAAAAAIPVKDTIKIVDENNFIIDTPDRAKLYAIQTPQTFKYDLILKAHKKALEDNFLGTDDTMLVERLEKRVKLIIGSYMNIKITTPEDLIFAEEILKKNN